MTTMSEIREEIERLTERRAALFHALSERHDAALAAEHAELEARIARLWDEVRALKARVRFGDRESIISRARQEERLERAA
jgi:ABC-type phosphate transport system auxiliary subunit